MQDTKKLYRLHEAARELGVSVTTLRRWDRDGAVKVVRTVGQHRLISLEEIHRLLGIYKAPSTPPEPCTLTPEECGLAEDDNASHSGDVQLRNLFKNGDLADLLQMENSD